MMGLIVKKERTYDELGRIALPYAFVRLMGKENLCLTYNPEKKQAVLSPSAGEKVTVSQSPFSYITIPGQIAADMGLTEGSKVALVYFSSEPAVYMEKMG